MRNPDKTPRKAYCTGCGFTFVKMHLMINHRRTDQCGGRFLSMSERHHLNSLRRIKEELNRVSRISASSL